MTMWRLKLRRIFLNLKISFDVFLNSFKLDNTVTPFFKSLLQMCESSFDVLNAHKIIEK